MSRSLATFKQGPIYLDTMILYTFVRAETAVRPIIRPFFNAIEQGKIRAYTAVLTFDELAYRLTLATIRDKYNGSPLDRLRNEEQKMLSEVYPIIMPTLQSLRQFPNLQIVDIVAADLPTMYSLMEAHHLKPRDALHVAAMFKVNCQSIASNDAHFDQVSSLSRYEIR